MITNIIVITGLIIYFTVVALNLTFTFTHLTVGDVPWYATGIFGELWAGRYHVEYWVYASDFLRFIPPILLATVIGLAIIEISYVWAEINVWVVVLSIVLEVLKLIWRLIQYGFCADFQFCRPFDPLVTTSGFGNTNFIWQWTVWGNFAWIAVLAVYLIIATQVEAGLSKYYSDLERQGIVVLSNNPQAAKDMRTVQRGIVDKVKLMNKIRKSYLN